MKRKPRKGKPVYISKDGITQCWKANPKEPNWVLWGGQMGIPTYYWPRLRNGEQIKVVVVEVVD